MLQKPNIIWWVAWLVRVLRLFRFGKDLLLSGYTSDIQKRFFILRLMTKNDDLTNNDLTRAMHRLLIFYWVPPRLSNLLKLYNYEVTLKTQRGFAMRTYPFLI